MSRTILAATILGVVAGCASTRGTKPHDMSAAQHEHMAQTEDSAADAHAAQYDPKAATETNRCNTAHDVYTGRGSGGGVTCWTSVVNPTAEHQRMADEHRRIAAEHRAASAALRAAEQSACVGISEDDRDTSPFERLEDIASVDPLTERVGSSKMPTERTVGATITFRAVPGMTAEWLQRLVDCHLARSASLGHVVPEMPDCPLVPDGVQATVRSTGAGFAVVIRSDDAATAEEILARARRLRTAAPR